MINFQSIFERIKAKLAFCLPVSHVGFSTNNTPDEEGMVMFVNTPTNPYVAISNGTGGILTLRSTDVPAASILSEVSPRIIVDGLFKSSFATPAFEFEAVNEAANNKKWDFVVQGTSLYMRTISDAGVVHIAMKIDRVDEYPSLITFPSVRVSGGDATEATHFVTLGQLGAMLTIDSPNATDLASAIALVNEIKAKLNVI